MATPCRRISDHGIADSAGSAIGRKSCFLRSGGNTRAVGLSAASNFGHCSDQRGDCRQNELDDIAILSDLIAGPAGNNAPTLSRKLIEACGSLVGVLSTAKFREQSIPDVSDEVRHRLQYFADAMGSGWGREALAAPIFATSQALLNYLQFEMALLKRETFRVLFLDSGNGLLRDQTMWEGSVNRVQIHPREVVRLALEANASALIMVHNHPSGRSEPSAEDVRLTEQIVGACNLLDIAVHDHLIVARNKVFSMRREQRVAFS